MNTWKLDGTNPVSGSGRTNGDAASGLLASVTSVTSGNSRVAETADVKKPISSQPDTSADIIEQSASLIVPTTALNVTEVQDTSNADHRDLNLTDNDKSRIPELLRNFPSSVYSFSNNLFGVRRSSLEFQHPVLETGGFRNGSETGLTGLSLQPPSVNTFANTSLATSFHHSQSPIQDNFGPLDFATTAEKTADSSFQETSRTGMYHPVYHHWFYRVDTERGWFYQKETETKPLWKPFSMNDSFALESAFSLPTLTEDTIVSTDGDRYDVYVKKRQKVAVYWEERSCPVRRSSWFYKGSSDISWVPYEEDVAIKLEEEYKEAMTFNSWDCCVDMGNNEEVIMRSPTSIVHQIKSSHPFSELTPDSTAVSLKSRVVKRAGFEDFDISDGEPETCDHLLFLIHGIGQFCDLKFRTIVEVVDEFRNISLELVQTHFKEASDLGQVNRIEILPISWHQILHSEDTGVDARLRNISLPSVPRLRDFANDTILDVLYYCSPVYCQVIINAVALEMNKLYALFMKRNPNFRGKISVGGHSLGSLIVFDILSHQSAVSAPSVPTRTNEEEEEEDEEEQTSSNNTEEDISKFSNRRRPPLTRKISYVTSGHDGTGQPYVKYPRIHFHPRFFFAFGSPIGCFVASRSSEILGENFRFPTCPGFFNIFHPYDVIAYRIEPLIIPSLSAVKPVQIPHHKGRKRMHLELKETVTNVGQKLIDTVKTTWNMMYQFAMNTPETNSSDVGNEVNRVLQTDALKDIPMNPNLMPTEPTVESTDVKVGCINEGRRVDYVLQEAPVEYINEYLFAVASHLCYWTSKDAMLFVLREIYADMGIYSDNRIFTSGIPFDIIRRTAQSSGVAMKRTAPSNGGNRVNSPAKVGK